ncbi:cytochrome-c peroxidase [Lewinella sp. 4G2]|uniref:cytochrome-c peroxidase n=1 Tax=Lewinella sp. 4G2 TaxID=1803372 RepID=UPI0007E1BF92|nr:cytochrome c peroxidase [Lewinella sp. 4G2]OAV43513.1 cytochrome-c peroxidase [Lewinella sp. 4G2]
MKQLSYLFVMLALVLLATATGPVGLRDYWRPAHFPEPAYDFAANPLRQGRVELGKRLFYDEILSADGTIACATCHSPFAAFAHTDHDLSHGIDDRIGLRNAPALFNLAWTTSFHHDGAHHSIELQPLAPIHHEDEMGSSINEVITRLRGDSSYAADFQRAFGEEGVTGPNLLKALAQFQLTLVSAGARYDRIKAGRDSFTNQELKGYQLFKANCNACHTEPLFTNYAFERNGLAVDTTLNDFGRMMITNLPEDSLRFKVPSLRNLSFTHPYMHDGRFRKLRQVLRHYATREDPIPLSANDQSDLIAFLLTLDDREFVLNKEHRPW